MKIKVKILKCYTKNCTTTKFRHANLMTLIFVGTGIWSVYSIGQYCKIKNIRTQY